MNLPSTSGIKRRGDNEEADRVETDTNMRKKPRNEMEDDEDVEIIPQTPIQPIQPQQFTLINRKKKSRSELRKEEEIHASPLLKNPIDTTPRRKDVRKPTR